MSTQRALLGTGPTPQAQPGEYRKSRVAAPRPPYTQSGSPASPPTPINLALPAHPRRDMTQLVAQPAIQDTPVQFLGQEDLLEEGMATHSSILAWRIPQTEAWLQSMGLEESDMT